MPDIRTVATHCPYCALQCGTQLTRERRGVSVRPTDFPVNRGGLCQKGWTAPALLDVPDRLRHPLVRRGGELTPVDWDTALGTVATGIDRIRRAHGPDAVGVFGGGGLTNEKAYLLGKFARLALGTSQIDYNGRFCSPRPRPRVTPPSGSTGGCRSRSPTSAAPTWCCWPGRTRPRPCRR